MRVTYDPGKSSRNEALRGLSFDLAKQFDWSDAQLIGDTRKDYNEQRIQALGYIGEHLHVISLRRANRRERTRYAAQAQP